MTTPLIVVEHDAAIALLMEDILGEQGYRTQLWSDSEGVYEFMRDTQPRLIILDLWLQHRNEGWALVQQLAHDSATAHIPLLICSSDTGLLDDREALPPSTCWSTLIKPFDVHDMLGKVETLLALSARMSERGATQSLSSSVVVVTALALCWS